MKITDAFELGGAPHQLPEQIVISPEDATRNKKETIKRIRVLMDKIQPRRKTMVNIYAHLYEILEANEENLTLRESLANVYFCKLGHNTVPHFLYARQKLSEGYQEVVLLKGRDPEAEWSLTENPPVFDIRQREAAIEGDPILKKEYDRGLNCERKAYAARKFEGDPPDETAIFAHACRDLGIQTYVATLPVGIGALKKLTKGDVEFILNQHLHHGCAIDPRVYRCMKAGLIIHDPAPTTYKLAKYIGHAIIIKNTSSGITTISIRIGTNCTTISLKSLEGYATAEKDSTTFSPLHEAYGTVNFDEFGKSSYKRILMPIFGYLQTGELSTVKAGKTIRSRGCARCVFTSNPNDLDESGCGSNSMMIELFNRILGELTDSIQPTFSRFAYFLFADDVQPVNSQTAIDNPELCAFIDATAESIRSTLRTDATRLYWEHEDWLNRPIPRYDDVLDALRKNCTDHKVRQALQGQKDAYRHMRGHALAEAIIDNAHAILNGQLNEDALMEDAEEALTVLININFRSWQAVLELNELYAQDIDFIARQIKVLPAYLTAILVAVARSPVGTLSHQTLAATFEQIPLSIREKQFGTYTYWSKIEGRFKLDRVRQVLPPTLQFFDASGNVVLTKEKLEHLRQILEKAGVSSEIGE